MNILISFLSNPFAPFVVGIAALIVYTMYDSGKVLFSNEELPEFTDA